MLRVRRASAASITPMGPWPMTSTVSSGGQIQQLHGLQDGIHRLHKGRLLKRHAVGNPHHAADWATIQSITRMYSAKPPPEGSKPAVAPTFL